jgi:hypothetical protein
MWAQYRKTLFPTQAFIVAACALGHFWGQLTLNKVLPAFVLMQVAAIAGAWWAAKLKRSIERCDSKLPLE